MDSHSSGHCVTAGLKRPTREPCGPHERSPIWSCSGWGLPCRCRYRPRGALLPHHFTLTMENHGGIFSVALSVGSHPPGVIWHPVLRSPDFPLPDYSWQRSPWLTHQFTIIAEKRSQRNNIRKSVKIDSVWLKNISRFMCKMAHKRLIRNFSGYLPWNEFHGAGSETRTRTLSPEPDFESGASTNSATPAKVINYSIIALK